MPDSVIIVGGGLAGLYAAHRLQSARIDFQLLEARERLGGRILSVDSQGRPSDDGFDLGPSWFWPKLQPEFADTLGQLALESFPQHDQGAVIFQTSRHRIERHSARAIGPMAMRIAGGTGSIISRLASGIPRARVHLNCRVKSVALDRSGVRLGLRNRDGEERVLSAKQVILAIPPRLMEASISFTPKVDPQSTRIWRDTPTWMAPHAKIFALYERPFWREAGLSGSSQSLVGPLFETHDATTASGRAALFGFIGFPPDRRSTIGEDQIIAKSVAQLSELFGPEAANPTATVLKDWAVDPLTTAAHDRSGTGHPQIPRVPWLHGQWADRAVLAASETSRSYPGYLAGAIEAGARAARVIAERLGSPLLKEAVAC